MSSSPQGDEKRQMQINAASNVLEEPEERARYDRCYDRFGPVKGTIVYETLSSGVVDAVFEDDTLADHLRGFVEVMGPVMGARTFETYYHQLDPPIPEKVDTDSLPTGYAVEDAGFGIAVWSFHQADRPCDLALWLTGGSDLWRAALQDPDDIDGMVDSLRARQQSTPTPTPTADTAATDTSTSSTATTDFEPDEESPATQISGHPSSALSPDQLPERYRPNVSSPSGGWTPDILTERLSLPTQRLERVVSYVGSTGAWGMGSVGAITASGLASLLVVAIAFVPLLAVTLVAASSVPALDSITRSLVGVPLVSADTPLETLSVVHYLTVGLLVLVPTVLSARYVVPWAHSRRRRGLPRDAWMVFVVMLLGLAGALFVGVRQGVLPRPVAVGVTALLTASTFQAALDVGAPKVLSQLCRSVAAVAFGLASAVATVTLWTLTLGVVAPSAQEPYTALLTGSGLLASPLVTMDNVELVVVGFGALAFVPLALTTLYSLTYALESVAMRLRSKSFT
jgi:hypothetical protein